MKTVVILDAECTIRNDLNFEELGRTCNLTIYDKTESRELTIKRLQNTEIALTNKTVIDKYVIDNCPSLKFVSVLATGYNVVDCQYAREKGIIVSNVPNYSTESVVQHTFALILNEFSKISTHVDAVKNNQWAKSGEFSCLIEKTKNLFGKTLGIIGYGAIGKRVAMVAKAFGMNVLINTRTPVEGCVDLNTLLKNSDVISLHCPLTSTNARMINEDTISIMKEGVVIVNTARGALVDESAVNNALNLGKISAYLSDVLTIEPPQDSVLISNEKSYVTPHIAWANYESRKRLIEVTCDNVLAYINKKPINVVN